MLETTLERSFVPLSRASGTSSGILQGLAINGKGPLFVLEAQGLNGAAWVLRNRGAAAGEAANWIKARAASGAFDTVVKPRLD